MVVIKSQISINSKNEGGNQANDSLLTVLNAKLIGRSAVNLTASPALSDSTILTDKSSDIKAIPAFDKDYAYTCKLLIPIKYLKTAGINEEYLDYNVKLNGLFLQYKYLCAVICRRPVWFKIVSRYGSIEVKNTPEMSILDFPTDFSGKYALAKKP